MKKRYFALLLPAALSLLLTGCGKRDYFSYVSECKEDIFCVQTDEYALTLSCVMREYPYIADGIPCPLSRVVEISITSETPAEYEVYVLTDRPFGGETTFRTYAGDYFFSQSVDGFFGDSVGMRVVRDGVSEEIVATSVKNEKTLTPRAALSRAVEAEKETIKLLTDRDGFKGEFYVRLLKRDCNYYYIGIVSDKGEIVSLLLDAQTGEVLARREVAHP